MTIIMVAGGDCDINQLSDTLGEYKDDRYIIGIDGGAAFLTSNSIMPDICIGDFDSVDVSLFKELPVIKLNPEKDETDTEYALLYALDKNPSKILLFGATGSRLDQTMASIEMLKYAVDRGIEAYIINSTNRIRVAVGKTVLRKADIPEINYSVKSITVKNKPSRYISVLPYSETLTDLTMKGFKYEIENFTLVKGISRCISNELASDTAEITCSNYYIVMETRD